MGILSDFVVADRSEANEIGASSRPADQWPCLEGWKGIDPIKLSTLFFCISGEPRSVDETVALSSEFEFAGGNQDEGPWVLAFPTKVAAALASIPEGSLGSIAAKWCATEELEMDGWTTDEAMTFISQLQPLARNAIASSKSVFLWLSL